MNEQIIEFLTELRSHNNREWFQDNKNRYDALRKVFIDEVQDLIGRISLFDPEVAGLEAKDCLFRIYRDIRFSPDKTPYKCHFAAYISQGGRASERGGYYIHLEPGEEQMTVRMRTDAIKETSSGYIRSYRGIYGYYRGTYI